MSNDGWLPHWLTWIDPWQLTGSQLRVSLHIARSIYRLHGCCQFPPAERVSPWSEPLETSDFPSPRRTVQDALKKLIQQGIILPDHVHGKIWRYAFCLPPATGPPLPVRHEGTPPRVPPLS